MSLQFPSVSDQHVVQFFEESDSLATSVGEFLTAGFADGDAAVVIATPEHLGRLERHLSMTGDLLRAREEGRYIALDAEGTLSKFMDGDRPDSSRFRQTVGGAIERALVNSGSRRVRAFGEMVAVLWARQESEAAIRLEHLWNDLSERFAFKLLCAYPMNGFESAKHGPEFERICGAHSRVIPGEAYTGLSEPGERLRAIAKLQQKARSLENEIAQRKKVEQALLRRERELSDFLENAVEGLHRVRPDGTILWANRAELDLFGYSAEEYIGHDISEFHADPDVIDSILKRLLSGETLHDQPARIRCKDGSIKHIRINSNALWEDGKFVSTRCFTRDVTDRVQLEAERQERLEELAEADRRKSEFLAMLSHELRNPISPLLLATELIRRHPGDPALVRKRIETIERQAQRMSRLVDDLLDVSRITRGTIQLRMEAVPLESVIAGAVELARPLIEERNHQFTIEAPEERILLRGDGARLEQVLANLLTNAAKYTDRGGRIALEAARDGSQVTMTVRDDGIGMTAELRERAFDLFVQGPDSPTRSPGGLGVGLALVRRVVELHGGTIEARSEGPRRGSQFVVRLPLERPD